MGRKLEFNYDRAIEQATRLFWRKGYRAASMSELLDAMGIGEGSFYHSFESKDRLYLECLKHYNATVNRRRLDALSAEPSVRRGIRNFFWGLLDDLDARKTPHVCLMARSLSAEVIGERKLRPYVKTQMAALEKSFSNRLEAAKQTGELPADFASEMSAKIIFTYLQGYFRVVKVLKSGKQMREEIEALLKSLGL